MAAGELDEMLSRVRAAGLRVTPQRRAILQVLLEDGGHLTAQQVYDRVRQPFPELSLDTVYRTLRTLAQQGILCQSHLQTRHAHRFSLAAEGRHHHHLICIACGHSVDFAECALPASLAEVARRHGFAPTGHAFEIYGYCGRCRGGGGDGDER
ncbi:MAG TPA: Fur family transcriptional regulator [Bacillota bacterium]